MSSLDDTRAKVEDIFTAWNTLLNDIERNQTLSDHLQEERRTVYAARQSLQKEQEEFKVSQENAKQQHQFLIKMTAELHIKQDAFEKEKALLLERKKEYDKREEEIKQKEIALAEKMKSADAIDQNMKEIQDKEKILDREKAIDRERKQLLDALERNLKDKEQRLERMANV